MKVFEVVTEHCEGNSNKIEATVFYVTSNEDTLLSVAEYYTEHCEQYDQDLKSVKEVLTIIEHIENK